MVLSTRTFVNSCFNPTGSNPDSELDAFILLGDATRKELGAVFF